MSATELLYLSDFSSLEFDARVEEVFEQNGKIVVVLDRTFFYPQGGGQPYDQGSMHNKQGEFRVEEVRFVDGIVKHVGFFEMGHFTRQQAVHGSIDRDRRRLHSRLHSAGHVVDWAVLRAGLPWVPGKGYHFPDGPYVEYSGLLADDRKETLKDELEELCAAFIASEVATKLLFVEKSQMPEFCHHVPDNLPQGKPTRVVLLGDFGVPCGGTHVSNVRDIVRVIIRKIKKQSGGTIRVGYDVEEVAVS